MMDIKNYNHFSHILSYNKDGFTFMEVMIAVFLLSLFGTSLFIAQAKMFSSLFKTHQKVVRNILSAAIMPDIIVKTRQALDQKKDIETVTIDEQAQYPNTRIQLNTKKIPQSSEQLKSIAQQLRLVRETITITEKQFENTMFVFAPPISKTEESVKSSVQNNAPNTNASGVAP